MPGAPPAPLEVGTGGDRPVLEHVAQPGGLDGPEVDHPLGGRPAPRSVGLEVNQRHLPDVAGVGIGTGVLCPGPLQVPAQVTDQAPDRPVVLHSAGLAHSLEVGGAKRGGLCEAGHQDPHLQGVKWRRGVVTTLQGVQQLGGHHVAEAGQGELVGSQPGALVCDPGRQILG